MSHTALRICPLCEATCGLVLSIDDGRISGARGDRDDVFSHGFICPKGASFAELDNDPDRLTQPMVRRDADTGGSSVGVYLGNPNAHTIAGALYGPAVIRALGTRAIFSASTLDQMPKHIACGYLYGNPLAFTVPDLDRTDYLVIIGANPLVSNGSLATAADFGGRLKALRRRGGKLIVLDPNQRMTGCANIRRTWAGWPNTSSESNRSAPPPPTLGPRRWPGTAGSRPRRSAPWPARSPQPAPRRSTAGSAPRP